MPVDRPTFSESWYRVAGLRPRLIASVRVGRQHFRGRTWHVVQDPANNQFFRLSESAYRFVGLLDGRRTVAEAWRICNEQLGDEAPTQGEAIQLLGQLYTSNLLSAELPPDAEGLFNRYRRRVTREVQGYLTNFLFARIPLLDPDRFLDRWVAVFGWLFSWFGAAFWLALVGAGLYFLIGRTEELSSQTAIAFSQQQVLSNLPLMYLSFILIKVCHEFGHAFACKKFGRQTGTGGEVHAMGVMFLVFTPLPYVDASSSWAFRNKWHRIVVGLGGMLVEIPIAAVAAIIWARTADSAFLHNLCFNVIFVAGVSTVLFNANPLLRYDGYYVLADWVEMPNLWQRSRQYVYYLVKRYAWGVRNPHNPANTRGERYWLTAYGLASTVYRVFVCVAILLFIADALPLLGAALAIGAIVAWVVVPLGKFAQYLATGPELARVRARAIVTTLVAAAAVAAAIGAVPAPDHCLADGMGEPRQLAWVHMPEGVEGFVVDFLPSGEAAAPDGLPLLVAVNPELQAECKQLSAELEKLAAQRRIAADRGEAAEVNAVDAQLVARREQLSLVEKRVASLTVRAPFRGRWVSPKIEDKRGAYVRAGEPIGMMVGGGSEGSEGGDLVIRTLVAQDDARLIADARPEVEFRVRGNPDIKLTGRIEKILPAGQDELPSRALGQPAGGAIPVLPGDRQGMRAAERFFEVRVRPDAGQAGEPLIWQRVVVRFEMESRPLAVQWFRTLMQLLQRRFQT